MHFWTAVAPPRSAQNPWWDSSGSMVNDGNFPDNFGKERQSYWQFRCERSCYLWSGWKCLYRIASTLYETWNTRFKGGHTHSELHNLRSGVPLFFVAVGRHAWYNYLTICLLLVQNLDFSLIGQETKRYLELSHDWLPLWRYDFRLKISCELMNSIMTSDEASEDSEFLSALNTSLQSFLHKTFKDEQKECIHRIAFHRRDVLAVQTTGLGKSAEYVLSPFSLLRNFRKQNTRGNVSNISVNYTCYRQIGSKFTNHRPLAWRRACLKFTLMAVIGGFPSDLSKTPKTSGNSSWFSGDGIADIRTDRYFN